MMHLHPRRLVTYILSLVLCAVPAVFLNNLYGYLPLLMLLLLGGVSAVYLALLQRGISCEAESGAGSCLRRTELDFSVRLVNRSILVFPRVELIFFIEGDQMLAVAESAMSVTLSPREERKIPFHAVFDHIGEYAVGMRAAVVYGPLGIRSAYLPVDAKCQVLVTPCIWEMDGFPLSRQVTAEDSLSRKSIAVDGMDYTGVRPYVQGDPLKNIHWKLSAHTREYLTKQREAYGSAGVTVVLDLCYSAVDQETGLTILDALVESAAAVCRLVKHGGSDCEIAFFDRSGSERRYVPRWNDSFFDLVSALPPVTDQRERYSAVELLRHTGAGHSGNVILCTAGLTEELTRLMSELHRQKKHVVLIQVISERQTKKEQDEALAVSGLLTAVGISCFRISSAEELREMGGVMP